jgi:hypothetical protein
MSTTNDGNNKPQADDVDTEFSYGDWVEFKLNLNVFGIVVGSDCLGLKYDVQLSPSGVVVPFFGVTLQPMERSDEFEPPLQDEVESNVIDFTRERELRAATKTQGAA